jgi:hypothetical protein
MVELCLRSPYTYMSWCIIKYRDNITPFSLLSLFINIKSLRITPVLTLIAKMDATCSSETSVGFQRTTRRYIPEDERKVYDAYRLSVCLSFYMSVYPF